MTKRISTYVYVGVEYAQWTRPIHCTLLVAARIRFEEVSFMIEGTSKTKGDGHETTYYVDNEVQHTTEKELTVRQILVAAGDDPETHYLLELRGNHQIPHKELDELIKIHENDRFAAIFTGPTPVS
jgi:hypothetical protein